MFEQWLQDQHESSERDKYQSIFVGSFFNPEAARKMLGSDSTEFSSSEEDFEASIDMVRNQDKRDRRKRRKVMDG